MGIAGDIKTLGEDIVASYDQRVKALGELVADTHKTLKGFAADRKKMSENQAKALADFVADLTKNVGVMIKGFQKEYKEMTDNLKAGLEKGETDRLKTFKNMMGDINKDIKDIETYVKNKLKEFSDAHADMSEELKKDLSKYVAAVVSETKKLLGGFADEREKMSANWQALTATMDKRRGIKPKVAAEVKIRPVEEVVEEEEAPAETGMEERVLEFIESHPEEGVRVSDMEEFLGVARTRLGKIAKRLLDEGKVRREENLYFPL